MVSNRKQSRASDKVVLHVTLALWSFNNYTPFAAEAFPHFPITQRPFIDCFVVCPSFLRLWFNGQQTNSYTKSITVALRNDVVKEKKFNFHPIIPVQRIWLLNDSFFLKKHGLFVQHVHIVNNQFFLLVPSSRTMILNLASDAVVRLQGVYQNKAKYITRF